MERRDALMFPVIAGVTLVGLFVMFKLFDKDIVNYVITAYIGVVSVFVLGNEAQPVIEIFLPSQTPVLKLKLYIPFSFRISGAKPPAPGAPRVEDVLGMQVTPDNRIHVSLHLAAILSYMVGTAITVWYVATRHFVSNNLIGIAISMQALESLSVGSFKTGAVLLSLLFFYDIFFVFGTDVMVTVAKSVDAPIKLLFPRAFAKPDADALFSMLGLGDIVLPGVFVALVLRFDATQAKLVLGVDNHVDTAFAKPVFNVTMFFYAAGLCATVVVMHVFKHAQPALLYLVPACLAGSLVAGAATRQLGALLDYKETEDDEAAKPKAE